ncbi:hypothetical protein PhCBS80983_g04034 [Powellomyces hirtus]|uniref:Uncharacterized protein n=1 Tax=Powellomyces hirtus TaxID=109895 RepID=A0A507DZS8_9FUNG|nr:hypothetical protein PhCBS80983_g04034 [Powellomyces hirtus]
MASIFTLDDEAAFKQFSEYPWTTDKRFQEGLKSILATAPTDKDGNIADKEAALQKAKFFYFSKFVKAIKPESYNSWKTLQTDPARHSELKSGTALDSDTADTAVNGSGKDEAQYPRSFQEICEMVARGEQVPGIKQIPNKLNEAAPSTSNLNPRKKPWETGPTKTAEPASDVPTQASLDKPAEATSEMLVDPTSE